MTNYIGIDLSPAHYGYVCLNDHGLSDWGLWVNQANHVLDDKHFVKFPKKTDEDKECYQYTRLSMMTLVLGKLLEDKKPDKTIINIEDYAFAARSRSITLCAEIGGAMRFVLTAGGYNFRMTAPSSLKKFATGNGRAKKRQMLQSFSGIHDPDKYFGCDMSPLIYDKKDIEGPITDLIDAWWLAEMARVEHQLKTGELIVENLNEKRRSVFTDISKGHELPLMYRPYTSMDTSITVVAE